MHSLASGLFLLHLSQQYNIFKFLFSLTTVSIASRKCTLHFLALPLVLYWYDDRYLYFFLQCDFLNKILDGRLLNLAFFFFFFFQLN